MNEQSNMREAVAEAATFMNSSRFEGIKRLYDARQVAEQQGTIYHDYSIAKAAAHSFFKRLRALYDENKSITTFGPYSPGQAVMMKRAGIEGIYLGGWATSAKGSTDEDPGADLASYPLSQVPNEAAAIVRALIAADKNQTYSRFNMKEGELAKKPKFDFAPYIIADADTGHGGDAQIRNLIRRFVEVGVPGYHIEDQKPGTKKCGHQGGKVLVACDEQIKRLNAARFQLDTMRVEGIIVARTDAEAATLMESISDERDQPFVLGATNPHMPTYKEVVLTLHSILNEKGVAAHGHILYHEQLVSERAAKWIKDKGLLGLIEDRLGELLSKEVAVFESAIDQIIAELVSTWEEEARVKTQSEAAVAAIELALKEGSIDSLVPNWKEQVEGKSFYEVETFMNQIGVDMYWNCEVMRSPEGYYQIRGGIPFAIAKSLAVAPFADILWMETKTADLEDARIFAEAIHAVYPEKMLAYNLSPSFNWDSTGMTEEEMTNFPEELAKLGFVFNFITYGGHQIDGLAAEEFSNSLTSEGMLALAKVQRKLRMLESPYKTPQSHVGGSRLDGALAASSGRTATTKAMGKGSTQFQHQLHIELPTTLLTEWIEEWAGVNGLVGDFKATMRPQGAGSSVLELAVFKDEEKIANVVFSTLVDRYKSSILSVRDQNTFVREYRRKRLMTLVHLFLLNRFKSNAVHYLTPSKDNVGQCEGMKKRGIYKNIQEEIGHLIVADVNGDEVVKYLENDKIESLLAPTNKESILV